MHGVCRPLLGHDSVAGSVLGQCGHQEIVGALVALVLQQCRRSPVGCEPGPDGEQERAGPGGQVGGQCVVSGGGHGPMGSVAGRATAQRDGGPDRGPDVVLVGTRRDQAHDPVLHG